MAEMLWNRRNLSRHGIKLQDLRLAIQIAIVNAAVYFTNCCKSPTISNVQAFKVMNEVIFLQNTSERT